MTTTTTQERRTVQLLRNDPVRFANDVLGVRPWSKQNEVLRSVAKHQRTAVRSNFASGKSFIAAVVASWFLPIHRPSLVITTAPTFRQVKDILWREIGRRHSESRLPLGGELTQVRWDIDSDVYAMGFSTDDPEKFRGLHSEHVLVIVDEASGVPEDIFEAIENPLASGHTRLLLIGNPTQTSGTFYNSFTSPLYNTIHISAFDTPNFTTFGITIEDYRNGTWKEKIGSRQLPCPYLVTPDWVDERYQEWGEGSYAFQVMVLGEFPEAGPQSLFSVRDVERAMERSLAPEGPKITALDVSRYGDDETYLTVRQGMRVIQTDGWHHQDTVYTAGRVKRFLMDNPDIAEIRPDVIGVGAGVVDMLESNKESFRAKIRPMNVGEQAIDKERFGNRRAELYWHLKTLMQDDKIDIPDDPILKNQLCDIQYRYDQKGRLWIESKEKARERGSKSPDRADSLMMAFDPRTPRKKTQVWEW